MSFTNKFTWKNTTYIKAACTINGFKCYSNSFAKYILAKITPIHSEFSIDYLQNTNYLIFFYFHIEDLLIFLF